MAMRRAVASQASVQARRTITGAAPVLHFPKAATETKEAQEAKNTQMAIKVMKMRRGHPDDGKSTPYVRKFAHTIEDIQAEIDEMFACTTHSSDLPASGKIPATMMMERVLRHGVCSYLKDTGCQDWDLLEKWLVYTAADQQSFKKLKKDADNTAMYAKYQKSRGGAPCVPNWNWEEEYAATDDREVVAERRKRYDAVAAKTYGKDEAAIDAFTARYSEEKNAQRLDQLVLQMQTFKPFIAKDIITRKLIERSIDGQLTSHQYADWNASARDTAEADEEIRVRDIFLMDSKGPGITVCVGLDRERWEFKQDIPDNAGLVELLEQAQAAAAVSSAGGGGKDAEQVRREKMIAEIVKLQSGAGKSEEVASAGAEKETDEEKAERMAKIEAAKKAERAKYHVDESKVKSVGLVGLKFLDAAPQATAQA